MNDAPIILDFLCYNNRVNLADQLEKSLEPILLDLIRRIADASAGFGFPMYLVGGFVRDLLLDRPIKDLDLTLEGDAIALGRALVKEQGGRLTVHKFFGTATWTFDSPVAGLRFLDLISTRKEFYTHPGALPTVTRSTIDDDLRRRDFTINAMAIRLDGSHFGELYDPLQGQQDLESQAIRTLHPNSFLDDPTRIFRAIRYEGRNGFKMEPGTRLLINPESLEVLKILSGERLRHEVDLIFEEQDYPALFARLANLGVLTAIEAPDFNERYASLVDKLPDAGLSVPCDRVMLGYLLWLTDSDSTTISRLSNRLRFTSGLTETLISASMLKQILPGIHYSKASQWTVELEELPPASVYGVHLITGQKELLAFLASWRRIKPVTTGNDLKARGLEPGPRYREILRQLRTAWLDGDVKTENDEKTLLDTLLK